MDVLAERDLGGTERELSHIDDIPVLLAELPHAIQPPERSSLYRVDPLLGPVERCFRGPREQHVQP
jgi:hypothetical protein